MRWLIAILALAGCSHPPEQPDLNTYGAIQPLCLFGCRQTFTLTEGDSGGGQGSTLNTTVTTTEQRSGSVGGP